MGICQQHYSISILLVLPCNITEIVFQANKHKLLQVLNKLKCYAKIKASCEIIVSI